MSWEHPPFKVGHSADEVLSGVPSTPGPGIDYTFPSSVEVHRGSTSVADFDASDYVNLSSDKTQPIHMLLHKIFPQYFRYSVRTGKIDAFFVRKNGGTCPALSKLSVVEKQIWRGSSRFIAMMHRILITLVFVGFLNVPMFVLTYIQPTGFVLLTAALFSTCFAIAVAISSRATNYELVGITAAYAAVIMVFVGNAIQSRNTSH